MCYNFNQNVWPDCIYVVTVLDYKIHRCFWENFFLNPPSPTVFVQLMQPFWNVKNLAINPQTFTPLIQTGFFSPKYNNIVLKPIKIKDTHIANHDNKFDAVFWNVTVQNVINIKKRRQQGFLKDDSLQQQSDTGPAILLILNKTIYPFYAPISYHLWTRPQDTFTWDSSWTPNRRE